VRVSGGVLKPHIFERARIATLNTHHGMAPMIRVMWSIPWGIVEGRASWIGVTIHEIDAGIDTGRVLWNGTPQLAPGDTDIDLFFRSHVEAAEALANLIKIYAAGGTPPDWTTASSGESAYRSAPGLGARFRLRRNGRGLRAHILVERGLRC